MEEPAAYGKLGLANLLEHREECLREFHFVDAYRTIKQRLYNALSFDTKRCFCDSTTFHTYKSYNVLIFHFSI